VGEASLPSPIHSGSGFAARFAADAKKDSKGRSLRDLQLQTRLMRYPLSYLIYAPSFEGLPKPVKDAVFAQISLVLRGTAHQSKYAHLTPEVRAAIREILLETLPASVRHFL
jgi:hypothetical protein